MTMTIRESANYEGVTHEVDVDTLMESYYAPSVKTDIVKAYDQDVYVETEEIASSEELARVEEDRSQNSRTKFSGTDAKSLIHALA